jgi:hypothetical protein
MNPLKKQDPKIDPASGLKKQDSKNELASGLNPLKKQDPKIEFASGFLLFILELFNVCLEKTIKIMIEKYNSIEEHGMIIDTELNRWERSLPLLKLITRALGSNLFQTLIDMGKTRDSLSKDNSILSSFQTIWKNISQVATLIDKEQNEMYKGKTPIVVPFFKEDLLLVGFLPFDDIQPQKLVSVEENDKIRLQCHQFIQLIIQLVNNPSHSIFMIKSKTGKRFTNIIQTLMVESISETTSIKDLSDIWKTDEPKKQKRSFKLKPVTIQRIDSFDFNDCFGENLPESPLFEKLSVHQQNMVSPLWDRLDIFPKSLQKDQRSSKAVNWMDILEDKSKEQNYK